MKRTVLVVEDEAKIARLIRDYLERAGYAVVEARDGEAALAQVRMQRPDLVLLDLGLPGAVDGLDVTRRLRQTSSVPIIVVTARTEETDRVVGLEVGADDYVTKPFSPKELVARVRAVLRRADGATPGELVRAGSVEIDVPKRRVTVAGRDVDLTATEFDLLLVLARHPGRIFTRAQLLDAVRGISFESYERAIDSHIKNLRRKVESDPRRPEVVVTVYGVGYKLDDDA